MLILFHCIIHASLIYFSSFLLVCLINLKENPKKLVSLISMLVVVIKRKPKKISRSSFACWELSRVNSFISFLSFGGWEEKTIMKMFSGSHMHDCWFNLEPMLLCLPSWNECLQIPAFQRTCTIIIIHTVRSCKWKEMMMIYDGLIEMRKAGMSYTSLVFVNMMSSSFLIQPIMSKHVCNDN